MKQYPALCLKIAYFALTKHTYYGLSVYTYPSLEAAQKDLETEFCMVVRLITNIPELIKETTS